MKLKKFFISAVMIGLLTSFTVQTAYAVDIGNELNIESSEKSIVGIYPKIEKEWKERDLVMRLTKLIKFSDFEGITITGGQINYQRRGEDYFEDLECDINKEDLSRLLKKNFIVKEKNEQYLLRLRSDLQ